MPRPAILFVYGASGAGKSATVRALAARSLPGVRCHQFDDIGVPSIDVMTRDCGSVEAWQAHATRRWVEKLAAETQEPIVHVLEGQTRASMIRDALEACAAVVTQIVFLNCDTGVRNDRLRGPRGRPDLVTHQMDCWAAYLCGQAHALRLPIVDTTHLTIEDVADALVPHVEALRRQLG
jgi:hypothetical protein